jgi:glutamine synthetase
MAGRTEQRLSGLGQKGKVIAEYVWIGGAETTGGFDIRSKPKTLDSKPTSCSELPIWNYDGSSTGQAPGADSEVLLRPVAIFDDPFRGGDNVLVLCETLTPAMEPIPTNTRAAAKAIFDQKLDEKPWFGIEQEYTLYELDKKTPLGWPVGGFPGPQGPYYCSAGADVSFGRNVMDDHYKACLYAGITIAGTNAEVMPGQWEYQIGPCVGIDSGDHMWMSRYLMIRVCEALGVNVTFDPKPMAGDWNGAGCHTNYSTEKMRNAGGYSEIISAIEKLKVKHSEHIAAYGEGNERRLTGAHETAPITQFSYGVANRGASVRIPRTAEAQGCGYFEDRRPASNMDPYVVTSKIFKTTVLDA